MRDQLVDRHKPVRNRLADMIEIDTGRVAAADQHHLALVKFRVGEGDVLLDDADQHQASAMRDKAEGAFHRRAIASRIENHIEAVSPGQFRDRGFKTVIADQP